MTVDDAGASAGLLQQNDVITSVDGTAVTSVDGIRSKVQDAAGAPVTIGYERGGVAGSVSVTPRRTDTDGQTQYLLGVGLMISFDLPVDVKIQLNDVGGPSAGMMFALGIIDKMSPGDLTGGRHFAGTGTIDADGDVGPIGGIRQKLYGARDAGATVFLAPRRTATRWWTRARRHPGLLHVDAAAVADGPRDGARRGRSRRPAHVWLGIVAFTAYPEKGAPRMKG